MDINSKINNIENFETNQIVEIRLSRQIILSSKPNLCDYFYLKSAYSLRTSIHKFPSILQFSWPSKIKAERKVMF